MSKRFPFTECPSYIKCSAPICPLDRDEDLRVKQKGDEKCRAWKSTRLKIGKKHNLPRLGMNKKEYAGKKRWDSLPPQKKKKIKEQGINALKSAHKKK